MRYIALDIGSSFVKGALLDLEQLEILEIRRAPFPDELAGLPEGHFEVDPARIVAEVQRLIASLIDVAPDVRGILCCCQMGGVILADAQGNPLTSYLSWRDQRTVRPLDPQSGPLLDRVQERLGTEVLLDLGKELKPGSMFPLLVWLQERNRLPEGTPLALGDFVAQQLCHATAITEPTLALGAINLRHHGWHVEAIRRLGLESLQWPALGDFRTPVGTFRHAGREIPWHPAVGDHQAALAGALLQTGELSINISTGSQLSRLTQEFLPGAYQTRPYFDGRYLNTITHIPAGRSLQVLIDLLTELPRLAGAPLADPWKLAVEAAERASDSELSVELSFFAGPFGDRGRVQGITTDNLTVGGLFRAAFINMADNYRQCADRIAPEGDWSRIVFSGGLAQKIELLRSMLLKRLSGPARVAPFAEDALMGLMVLGMVVSGRATAVQTATKHISVRH
ncbi:MAG: sedoheptulokinase [Planctomycetales bacterium]